MRERWTERNELLSELHHLHNDLIAQVTEVKMAIMREEHAYDAKNAGTVTDQTKELLSRGKRTSQPELELQEAINEVIDQETNPESYQSRLRRQASMQDDAKSMQTKPPYDSLLQ